MATELSSAPSSVAELPSTRPEWASSTMPRLWPAVLMLTLFWAAYFVCEGLSMTGGMRFVSRLAMHVLLLLGCSIWWLSRRQLSRRERWYAVAVFVIGSVAMLKLADQTIGVMAILLAVLPWVLTVGMVWLAICKFGGLTARVRMAGLWLATLCVFGFFTLVRFDGLDGSQHSEYAWRWNPTSEQVFLTSHQSEANAREPGITLAAWSLQPGDLPSFRGQARDGVVDGNGLALDWRAKSPQKIWRQRLGPGWSSLIVVNGHVVTQEQRNDDEVVACYDAATGKEVWIHTDKVRFHESLSGAGPRGTPTFADGKIYALGGKGNFNCLDAATGKLLWSHDLVQEAQAAVPQWGFAVSPLVVDGVVIVFAPGKDSDGLLAYDTASGDLKWKSPAGGDTYSSPQLAEFDGVRQILMHDSQALRSFALDDGKLLWEVPNGGEMAIPMLQPRVLSGNQVLVALEPGLTLLELKQDGENWAANEVWVSNRIRPNFNDLVTHKGKIYGLDDGILSALDLETGERLWKKGRYGHGQVLLLADRDALVVLGARGEVSLVGIGGEQPEVLGEFESISGKTWNHPALVGNRLFVRNGEEIACYELPTEAAKTSTAAGN
ncbi:MAG: PQQ-binding-like beta-propeller repeat protein [Pirellulales bacterium]